MKRIALILLLASCPAKAYDDDRSLKVYMHCLVEKNIFMSKLNNQYPKELRPSADEQTMSILSMCDKQAYDFMRYNCPGAPEQCEGTALQAASEVVKKMQ